MEAYVQMPLEIYDALKHSVKKQLTRFARSAMKSTS